MFGTSGIRGPFGETVTGRLALDVGRALATDGADRVVIGRDVRTTGQLLADAFAAGLQECGTDVIDVGIAATPTVARSVGWLDADAGVVITASHNPPADNGIKLWTPSGKAFGPDRQAAIEAALEEGSPELANWDETGTRRREDDVASRHVTAIRTAVGEADCSVVVDVGNGSGAVTAQALAAMGCSVRTLNAQEDGTFPGRPSEPNRETLGDLCSLVRETDADLGVAHDGDADRMQAVDETGRFVPKDVLLTLFAREAAGPGDTVAVPVDTSLAVDDALAENGATVTRTPVGDVYVAERAMDEDVVFGGEPSGAWIWPDETYCPDGPLAAARLVDLVSSSGPLSRLVDAIDTYPIERTSIEVDDPDALVDRLTETIQDRYEEVTTLDGLRVRDEDGWFLLRASGTEPLVRVTAEGRSAEDASSLFETATEFVREARPS